MMFGFTFEKMATLLVLCFIIYFSDKVLPLHLFFVRIMQS